METLRVLITGGADFISSHWIKTLVRAEIERLELLERGFELLRSSSYRIIGYEGCGDRSR